MNRVERWFPNNTRPNPIVRVDFDGDLDLTGVTMAIKTAKNPTQKPFFGSLTNITTGTTDEGVYVTGVYDVTSADTSVEGSYDILCDVTISGETETVSIGNYIVSLY